MDERILKYFQNELDAAERLELLREIRKDDILKKQFSEYQNLCALINLSSYGENIDEGKNKYSYFKQWIATRKRHQFLIKLMKYAAVVILVIVSTCWLTLWTSSSLLDDSLLAETNTLYVPAGQRACITLQDGSLVWLNAQSTLIYPSHFSGSERKVQIMGEAFFEIAKNEKKPFYVVAQNAEMQVLGTKFNVYSYPETGITRTSLVEGVGKSETAIELVKRGHRLVADDAVEIKKVSNISLVGSSPDNIRHFLELRGIGIINARRLFGMGAVKLTEKIDLIVEMELWNPEKVYDRMGVDNQYTSILGVKVPSLTIPVKPGRNLAVILEVAAMNNRQKKMGYNAAQELLDKLGLDMEGTETVKNYEQF